LVALPFFAPSFVVVLLSDIFVFALFAAGLHYMMGTGGLISFGHAAFFGLGAYAAALAVKGFGVSMPMALVAAPVLAGFGAIIIGWFAIRLSGVYLAMLTLAAAQILWSTAIQWQSVTGGDDGILGIWPSTWATDTTAFYYLALALWGNMAFYCVPPGMPRHAPPPLVLTLKPNNGSQLSSQVSAPVSRAGFLYFLKAVYFLMSWPFPIPSMH
jgi:ABC-type branched-subunit amino acid transport system permease subunit